MSACAAKSLHSLYCSALWSESSVICSRHCIFSCHEQLQHSASTHVATMAMPYTCTHTCTRPHTHRDRHTGTRTDKLTDRQSLSLCTKIKQQCHNCTYCLTCANMHHRRQHAVQKAVTKFRRLQTRHALKLHMPLTALASQCCQ